MRDSGQSSNMESSMLDVWPAGKRLGSMASVDLFGAVFPYQIKNLQASQQTQGNQVEIIHQSVFRRIANVLLKRSKLNFSHTITVTLGDSQSTISFHTNGIPLLVTYCSYKFDRTAKVLHPTLTVHPALTLAYTDKWQTNHPQIDTNDTYWMEKQWGIQLAKALDLESLQPIDLSQFPLVIIEPETIPVISASEDAYRLPRLMFEDEWQQWVQDTEQELNRRQRDLVRM